MWIAIVYMCLEAGCAFVDSHPTWTEQGCIELADGASRQLLADPEVIAFDVTCIQIQVKNS